MTRPAEPADDSRTVRLAGHRHTMRVLEVKGGVAHCRDDEERERWIPVDRLTTVRGKGKKR